MQCRNFNAVERTPLGSAWTQPALLQPELADGQILIPNDVAPFARLLTQGKPRQSPPFDRRDGRFGKQTGFFDMKKRTLCARAHVRQCVLQSFCVRHVNFGEPIGQFGQPVPSLLFGEYAVHRHTERTDEFQVPLLLLTRLLLSCLLGGMSLPIFLSHIGSGRFMRGMVGAGVLALGFLPMVL